LDNGLKNWAKADMTPNARASWFSIVANDDLFDSRAYWWHRSTDGQEEKDRAVLARHRRNREQG
jgi:hypothetical protein